MWQLLIAGASAVGTGLVGYFKGRTDQVKATPIPQQNSMLSLGNIALLGVVALIALLVLKQVKSLFK